MWDSLLRISRSWRALFNEKWSCGLKVINIYHIISVKAWAPLVGPPDCLKTDKMHLKK